MQNQMQSKMQTLGQLQPRLQQTLMPRRTRVQQILTQRQIRAPIILVKETITETMKTTAETTAETAGTMVETTTVAAEGKRYEKRIANIAKKHAMLADKSYYLIIDGGRLKGVNSPLA